MICQAEDFRHKYFGEKHPQINIWKRTSVGELGTLLDVCLQSNGLPVTRKCEVRKLRAQWESTDQWAPVVCHRDFGNNSITSELNDLHAAILEEKLNISQAEGSRRTAAQLSSIVRQGQRTIQPGDVFLIAQVFTLLARQEPDPIIGADLVSVCQVVMSCGKQVLRLSAQLNATNVLLSQFEIYMDALAGKILPWSTDGCLTVGPELDNEISSPGVQDFHSDIGVRGLITENLTVFFINPDCDNVTGIAIFSASGQDRRWATSGFWFRFLRYFDDLDQIKLEPDLETAVFLPEKLWNKIKWTNHLIFKVYAHGAFLLRNDKFNSFSNARAISKGSGCGFWNYETWSSEGVTSSNSSAFLSDPIVECHTNHLTQFSFLVGGGYRISECGQEVPISHRVLDIISIVGCALSLLGVLGIFLTALISKTWRKQLATKVTLHFCLAISFQMLLFMLLNTDYMSEQLVVNENAIACVALGAAMHYSVLVFFSWTLVVAWRLFQKLVWVFDYRGSNYVLKVAVGAWGVPLIPTLLEAFFDFKSYLPSVAQLAANNGICYPSGYGLILGVVLPVIVIIMINLGLAAYSLYSITHIKEDLGRTDGKKSKQEIRHSIMLFFLMGLTWIFGIFAFFHLGEIFSYLFCITATMQGFVMFVYYVILYKVNREAWVALVCPTTGNMDRMDIYCLKESAVGVLECFKINGLSNLKAVKGVQGGL
uniref:LOW QUALITY PROTEIN: uncharacterized protein LOC108040700 n=1 Tax=Drosophila rhopaloa TaxID=1041015 RepID=A0A6P4E713_DRORH